MNKWIIGILVFLLAAIVVIYILIPAKLEISENEYIRVPSDAVYRFIAEENNWQRWWPQNSEASADGLVKLASFNYNQVKYAITYTSINFIEVTISTNKSSHKSNILIVPLEDDSTALHWRCFISTGKDPISKIRDYQQARHLKESMGSILGKFASYMAKPENIYRLNIHEKQVKDTILVSTTINTNRYPTNTEIYGMIKNLKNYISSQGAQETNYPMLNILKIDSQKFTAMVAIPVNKKIQNNKFFTYKRMVAGKILVAEVTGGNQRVEEAFTEMENYVKDYRLKSPAIPFLSLVTDRLNEPDTTKWITRIYYPIL
jgi:hypothetical protein